MTFSDGDHNQKEITLDRHNKMLQYFNKGKKTMLCLTELAFKCLNFISVTFKD